MKENPSFIKTHQVKETDYYSTLTEKEKAEIEFFLEWLQYVEVTQLVEKESPRVYRGQILGGSEEQCL